MFEKGGAPASCWHGCSEEERGMHLQKGTNAWQKPHNHCKFLPFYFQRDNIEINRIILLNANSFRETGCRCGTYRPPATMHIHSLKQEVINKKKYPQNPFLFELGEY